jgi:hypothetical protein
VAGVAALDTGAIAADLAARGIATASLAERAELAALLCSARTDTATMTVAELRTELAEHNSQARARPPRRRRPPAPRAPPPRRGVTRRGAARAGGGGQGAVRARGAGAPFTCGKGTRHVQLVREEGRDVSS